MRPKSNSPLPAQYKRGRAKSRFLSVSRSMKAKQHGLASLDPDDMKPIMRRTLILICKGHTNAEIAERTDYSIETVDDRTKALLAAFDARNRAHLAALAVAQGYVDMKLGRSQMNEGRSTA